VPVHAASARAPAARTCSTTAAAQAVGVLKDRWATASATLASISWPMPVSTGTGRVAMSRAIRSPVEGGEVGAGPAAPHEEHGVDR
jgi:hypothetical protein